MIAPVAVAGTTAFVWYGFSVLLMVVFYALAMAVVVAMVFLFGTTFSPDCDTSARR
ncbi:MAG: hypothetical protein PF501_04125 [Salinisphaera sp.]|jgi:uncharacterized metal-binding protein|nr:hypothetical protein [Salinisphaera sp.]